MVLTVDLDDESGLESCFDVERDDELRAMSRSAKEMPYSRYDSSGFIGCESKSSQANFLILDREFSSR